jgi:hypothetical protein
MQAVRSLLYFLLVKLAVRRLHGAARALRRAHRVAGGMGPVVMPAGLEQGDDVANLEVPILSAPIGEHTLH